MNNIALNGVPQPAIADFGSLKARQKATWESGDFGRVAKSNVPAAEEFMSRLDLRPGLRVLDVACGTGNLAMIAARVGCISAGVDIASNLIAQARGRAARETLSIDFVEGDAESLPYAEDTFDLVVSMFGAMFAPRPEVVLKEMCRVTKPGGMIAMANWTQEGFIGEMFGVFARYVPPPVGLPSPLNWGRELIVQDLFRSTGAQLSLARRTAQLRYPFDVAGTVEFFRTYYGPTQRAFEGLEPDAQNGLRRDLEELQGRHNRSPRADETQTHAEYLEIHARKTT